MCAPTLSAFDAAATPSTGGTLMRKSRASPNVVTSDPLNPAASTAERTTSVGASCWNWSWTTVPPVNSMLWFSALPLWRAA